MSKEDTEELDYVGTAESNPTEFLEISEERYKYFLDVIQDWNEHCTNTSLLEYTLMVNPRAVNTEDRDLVRFEMKVEQVFAIFAFILAMPEEEFTTEEILDLKIILLNALSSYVIPATFVPIAKAREVLSEESKERFDELMEGFESAHSNSTLQ